MVIYQSVAGLFDEIVGPSGIIEENKLLGSKFLALAFLPFIGWFKKKFSRNKESEYTLAVSNAEPEVSNSVDDSQKTDAGQEKS